MRALIVAGTIAACFGLFTPAPASAGPAGGATLAPLGSVSQITEVRYRCRTYCRHRHYSRRHCWRQCH